MQADAVLQVEACTKSADAGNTVMLFMYRWTQTNSPIQAVLTLAHNHKQHVPMECGRFVATSQSAGV